MAAPDPRWVYGFSLLGAIFVLGVLIALGDVQKEKSYGLELILGILGSALVQWGAAMFGKKDQS